MLYLFDRVLPFRLELAGIACDTPQKIGSFSLEFMANRHLEVLKNLAVEQGLGNTGQSYSIAVTHGNRRIVYSGDVRSALELLPLLEQQTDLLILEMAHFAPDEFRTIWEKCAPRKVVLTHFHPDLDVAPEKLLADIFEPYADRVVFAYDGMEVTI
jgi:ribonuclease BN (tRNA processing enzyme)